MSASTSAAGSTSRSTPTPRTTRSPSTAPATTRAWARARSPPSRRRRRCRSSQPQCITDATTELYDCGNWAVSASWNVPSTAVSGVYVALLDACRPPATGSHITFVVRDDASHSDVVVPDLGHHLAGLQHLRRVRLLPGRRQRPRLQGELQPPGRHPRRQRGPRLLLLQRVPAGALPGAERVRRHLHQPASTPTAAVSCSPTTRCSCPSVTTSTGAGRSAPTSRRPGTPGSTCSS